jgi:hypothetical protein
MVALGDGRCDADGTAEFVELAAPSDGQLPAMAHSLITRPLKVVTRRGALVSDMGQTDSVDSDADGETQRDAHSAKDLQPIQRAQHNRRHSERGRQLVGSRSILFAPQRSLKYAKPLLEELGDHV